MASPETRECAVSLKFAIKEKDELVSNILVPNCVYRCGCPEGDKCTFFKKFVENFSEDRNIFNIQERYDEYNEKYVDKYD